MPLFSNSASTQGLDQYQMLLFTCPSRQDKTGSLRFFSTDYERKYPSRCHPKPSRPGGPDVCALAHRCTTLEVVFSVKRISFTVGQLQSCSLLGGSYFKFISLPSYGPPPQTQSTDSPSPLPFRTSLAVWLLAGHGATTPSSYTEAFGILRCLQRE